MSERYMNRDRAVCEIHALIERLKAREATLTKRNERLSGVAFDFEEATSDNPSSEQDARLNRIIDLSERSADMRDECRAQILALKAAEDVL